MNWQSYAPGSTSRTREAIEWSINYQFNATDPTGPRVLLIGDSICKGYHEAVRRRLDGRVNLSFWASSKCVTDPDYFMELDHILSILPCSLICFNNGLHSLVSDRAEWTQAYRAAVAFMRDSLPDTLLSLTLSTPLTDPALTAVSRELNGYVLELAAERGLPVIDLFTPMDALDRERYWRDVYHFTDAAVDMQADIIARHVLKRLGLEGAPDSLERARTATGPDGRIE